MRSPRCAAPCSGVNEPAVGQFIDISMVECMASWNDGGYLFYQSSEGRMNPTRMGSDFPAVAPMGIFKARDGYVAITVLYDQWELFTRLIGQPELGRDPRFDTLPKRLEIGVPKSTKSSRPGCSHLPPATSRWRSSNATIF